MSNPLVSIIIPVGKGHGALAREAIASAEAQTVFCEIVVILDPQQKGPGWARNQGAQKAQGEFLVFLDADDLLHPDFLEHTLRTWRPGSYVYTDWTWGEGSIQRARQQIDWIEDRWHLVTTLLPKDYFLRVGGFNENLSGAEDTDLYMKLSAHGVSAWHCPRALVDYRPGGKRSASFIDSGAWQVELKEIKSQYKRFTRSNEEVNSEYHEGDVLVRAKWMGNRPVMGMVSQPRRDYGRTGNFDALWMDPRDAEALPADFEIVERHPDRLKKRIVEAMQAIANAKALEVTPLNAQPQPAVTIVTGTFNRGKYLARMIESAKALFPPSLGLDFVIVDGGSTDGTLEMLRGTPNVTLIEHGELKGAIKAFTEGGYAATGRYVVFANDDITFIGDSLLRAYRYLEDNPTCGAVAFADNRPIPEAGRDIYKVQLQEAVTPQGQHIGIPYAQVGMYPKWLGDQIGWWGANDPIMSKGRTYGGDNWLSAKICELGLTVDAVEEVKVEDHVVPDSLRNYNSYMEQQLGSPFYESYPRGIPLPAAPLIATPLSSQYRVLYLPIFEPNILRHRYTKRGLRDAMRARGWAVVEVDYLNEQYDLLGLVATFQPNLVLMQAHQHRDIPIDLIRRMRESAPNARFVNWNGDARGLVEDNYLKWCREIDLQLCLNAAAFPTYQRVGIRHDYWQIGFEEASPITTPVPAWDILFLGNAYDQRRQEMGFALHEVGTEIGASVGIYGNGWGELGQGETLYDFDTSAALYANAKLAVGDTYPNTVGFVSNRFFQALAAGALLLQEHMPDFENWNPGIRNGESYFEWRSIEGLQKLIRHLITNPDDPLWQVKRQQLGLRAVQEYSFPCQVEKLAELLGKYELIT